MATPVARMAAVRIIDTLRTSVDTPSWSDRELAEQLHAPLMGIKDGITHLVEVGILQRCVADYFRFELTSRGRLYIVEHAGGG